MIQKQEVLKPWGKFEQFTHNTPSTVKLIYVKTGESLSLQRHSKREEFWRIIDGNPSISIGDKHVEANPGDEFFIPANTLHRVRAGQNDVVFLEIALGDFDEDDIVRTSDNYGRA